MGFLSPLSSLALLSIAVLLLIYLRSVSRPTLEVSSLLLFDEVPAPVAKVRFFRADPLFWLQAAALAAALIRARGASRVDLFTDRPPSAAMLDELGVDQTRVHRIGTADENIAIVSLDPGAVRAAPGHCVIRNFSNKAAVAQLTVDVDGTVANRLPVLLAPREQTVATFGPILPGCVVH